MIPVNIAGYLSQSCHHLRSCALISDRFNDYNRNPWSTPSMTLLHRLLQGTLVSDSQPNDYPLHHILLSGYLTTDSPRHGVMKLAVVPMKAEIHPLISTANAAGKGDPPLASLIRCPRSLLRLFPFVSIFVAASIPSAFYLQLTGWLSSFSPGFECA